ncbi:MAG TPA: bifunctional hydroxymethylpyrimidine kinase/phosphomethylpyrimidine kinase [Candidatus Dormibacteraeota bacterium]|nr:bifunctional hydroxymethylpyrimidine kinase/phosphomethylpyrimidine kinase [Candidatus Dormibacteraeota bacterium]
MAQRTKLPVALTIAGSDSGGGAGIQADLKTFGSLGVHGTSALTCITAQNPTAVLGVQACAPKILRQQLEAVFAEFPVAAIKTGMLYSKPLIHVVVDFLKTVKQVPLVVDPVMISTSGARLLDHNAVRLLQEELLPRATLITPNLDEAQVLAGRKLRSVDELRAASRMLHERFHCAVLIKGGHLKASRQAIDVFFNGRRELLLTAPFVKGIHPHGAGCTYSAALAGYLALGEDLLRAVKKSKTYITQALARGKMAGTHFLINSLWRSQ